MIQIPRALSPIVIFHQKRFNVPLGYNISMSTSPTVAFVSDAIYPYNKGGKETRLYEVTTRLAAEGYDVHIYCMQWWKGSSDRVENGVYLHGICPYIPLYDGQRRSIKQGVLFGLSCFKLLTAKFDVVDVDHMPFFPLYSMRIVCWLKGKKMIATWHEVWGKEYWQSYLGGVKGIVAWWIERVSAFFPDIIIAVSEMTAERVKRQLGFTKKIVVVPNGIDLSLITKAPKSVTQSDLIYAGRLLQHKNVDVLLQAVALLKKEYPNLKVIIAGDGPEKDNLVKLSKDLSIEKNVTFLPFQENIQDLYGLMKSSKVFVLPSTREGFGLVVLEANACGIPVITSDHQDNAARFLITNKMASVVPMFSHHIADAILYWINLPKKGQVQELSQVYNWDTLVDRISKTYLSIRGK